MAQKAAEAAKCNAAGLPPHLDLLLTKDLKHMVKLGGVFS